MKTKRLTQNIQSILFLAGSFTFAFLLGEMVHEFGHYFGHLAYGNPDSVRVHLDPFGGSRIVGVASLSHEMTSVTSATGPLLNLFLGIACLTLLWRFQKPILLPFLLWGPIAMIQEGVNFSLGLLTPGGDAQWIAAIGIPALAILLAGTFLLIAGVRTIVLLLPLTAIGREDPIKDKALIIGSGLCSLMLIRFIHSLTTSPNSVMENLVPLIFSLLLATIIIFTYKQMTVATEKKPVNTVVWTAVLFSLALGASMFLLQIGVLN